MRNTFDVLFYELSKIDFEKNRLNNFMSNKKYPVYKKSTSVNIFSKFKNLTHGMQKYFNMIAVGWHYFIKKIALRFWKKIIEQA